MQPHWAEETSETNLWDCVKTMFCISIFPSICPHWLLTQIFSSLGKCRKHRLSFSSCMSSFPLVSLRARSESSLSRDSWLELLAEFEIPPVWILSLRSPGLVWERPFRSHALTEVNSDYVTYEKYSIFTYLRLIAFGNFTSILHQCVFTADRSPQCKPLRIERYSMRYNTLLRAFSNVLILHVRKHIYDVFKLIAKVDTDFMWKTPVVWVYRFVKWRKQRLLWKGCCWVLMTKPRSTSVNGTGVRPKLSWTRCFMKLVLHKYYTRLQGEWETPAEILWNHIIEDFGVVKWVTQMWKINM